MKHINLFVFCIFTAYAAFAVNAEQVVSSEGYGPIKIGMTLEQAVSIAHTSIVNNGLYEKDEKGCYLAKLENTDDVLLMLELNKITAILIEKSTISTREGAHVGMPAKAIKKIYPNWQPHPRYDGSNQSYQLFVPLSDKMGYMFTCEDSCTDDASISEYEAGLINSLMYDELCS